MKRMQELARYFARDEKATEVTELAIVLSLVVAGALVTIASIGVKVTAMYTTTNGVIP